MRITGTIRCIDNSDFCRFSTEESQIGQTLCIDNIDQFESAGFNISLTLWTNSGATFVQGKEIYVPSPLSLALLDRRYQGLNLVDGTYVDGTYTEPRYYDPIRISFGVYKNSSDGSSWSLEGYRFRDPGRFDVGRYYANMVLPSDTGNYRLEWLYKKDQSSDTTAYNQLFSVADWGNGPTTNIWWLTTPHAPPSSYNEIFGEWIGNGWGIRWPQYLW